jgi:DegV family protein with EDD domain
MELTARNTAIVIDSTADFPEAAERFPNWRMVPLYVRFGDESFRDHVEIDAETFYERLATASELPTTSQPTPQDFLSTYEELRAAGYERIYSLHLSAKLSGTHQSACVAAEEIGGDVVRVVDAETASLAVAMLALALQRRLECGTSEDEVEELIGRFRERNGVVFTVDTLEYLQKGGRIGRAQAFAGSLLNVKPILAVADGEIVPIARVRGRQKALEEFTKAFTTATEDRAGLRTAIAHSNAPEWVEVLTVMVEKTRPSAELELVEILGAVVGTHAGPGAVGFFWFQDEDPPLGL